MVSWRNVDDAHEEAGTAARVGSLDVVQRERDASHYHAGAELYQWRVDS